MVTGNLQRNAHCLLSSIGGGEKIIKLVFKIKIPDWLDHLLSLPVLLYRRLRYGYPFRRIPLSQGKFAIVDPDDYQTLSRYKWNIYKGYSTCYAKRKVTIGKKRGQATIYMHRCIIDVPAGFVVDHINHNGLDNRKANLRLATRVQNSRHAKKTNSAQIIKGYTSAGVNEDGVSESRRPAGQDMSAASKMKSRPQRHTTKPQRNIMASLPHSTSHPTNL